jgi:hypothetical protein
MHHPGVTSLLMHVIQICNGMYASLARPCRSPVVLSTEPHVGRLLDLESEQLWFFGYFVDIG